MNMSEELVDLGHAGEAGLRVDGLVNALTGMGTNRDKSQFTSSKSLVFLGQEELENLYSEWIPKRIVDVVAEQSTRKGFKVLFGGEGAAAKEVSGIEQIIEDLYILENLGLASKNARLFGGAVILLYIDDGRQPSEPVDYKNIRSVEGMEILDRWQIAPIINESSLYDYSKATYYQIISGDLIRQPQLTKIHKDRILRFDGEWLPYRIRQRNYGWGMSTLQSVYDSFRFYSTGISSAATLLTEFDIFVHKLRGLASMLAAGKEGDVRNRLVLNDMSKSVYRGYVIDAEKEELEFISRNFGGIGEVLEKLRIDIIGASQIPHTILFGESPGGLGSTGRSEERDFAKQNNYSAASANASANAGCTNNDSSISVTFKFAVTARAITLMSSAAWLPTMEPPSTSPVAGSLMIFTKPRGSLLMSAFAVLENGTLVTRILRPDANASASAKPTSAISGSVKIADAALS
jgi:phage-related protein (TIGR01555 family)